MVALEAALAIAGFAVFVAVMIALMARANKREQQTMARRRQEWIDNGAHPDEEPNFYTGNPGSSA